MWLLAAVLGVLGGLIFVSAETRAASSTTMIPACSGVNVRTGPSMSSAVRTHLATSATLTVVATVGGSHWSTTCPSAKSGTSWYRISAINGKSVSRVYGQAYLYAATGVLGAPPSATPDSTDAFGNDLTRLLNLDRVALGKKPYLVDARLAQIARDAPFTCPTNASLHLRGRAQDLADRHYFSHTVPGCYSSGTTPFRSIAIVRSVFGYTLARSEILHWNSYGTATTSYRLGCDINGAHCVGGTTTAPYTVTLAQRNFMSSAPHRAAELNSYQRVGCASAKGGGRTYFACLFADGGPTTELGDACLDPLPHLGRDGPGLLRRQRPHRRVDIGGDQDAPGDEREAHCRRHRQRVPLEHELPGRQVGHDLVPDQRDQRQEHQQPVRADLSLRRDRGPQEGVVSLRRQPDGSCPAAYPER